MALSSYRMRTSVGAEALAPGLGMFCINCEATGACSQALSSREPSIRMCCAVRTACKVLGCANTGLAKKQVSSNRAINTRMQKCLARPVNI